MSLKDALICICMYYARRFYLELLLKIIDPSTFIPAHHETNVFWVGVGSEIDI